MSDTFHSPVRSIAPPVSVASKHELKLPSIRQILSPPVSPATRVDQEQGTHETPAGHRVQDPELFPHRLSTSTADVSSPLFRLSEQDLSVEAIVDDHIKTNANASLRLPLPTRSEYILAATFRGKVVDRIKKNPQLYMQQELEFLSQYPKMFAPDPSVKRKADFETRTAKRQRVAPRSAIEKLPTIKRAPRASPREATSDSFDAEPAPKLRRKPSQTVPLNREDMDFRKIPDLAPAVSTMAPGKNLKIDLKGHPLDLSDDPDRHLLDDQEVTLASILRLTAGQYLFAKRKIFERYVELARIGKDFNKTSAQAVCHIDVNKASKLWTAFEKVGWFDRRHFTKYL